MKKEDRKKVQDQKEKWLTEYVESIQNGKVKEAKDALDAINGINQYITLTRKTNRWLPFIIAAFCTFIIGLCVTLRVPSTFIRIVVSTDLIAFQTKEDYVPNTYPITADEVSMSLLGGVTSYYTDDSLSNLQVEKLELTGGNKISVFLEKINKSSWVQLTKRDTVYSIWNFREAPSKLNLQVDTINFALVLDNQTIQYSLTNPIPEVIETKTVADGQSATQVELFNTADFALTNIEARQVSFIQEEPPRSNQYVSGLKSGKVMIFERNMEKEIFQGDFVTLTDFESKRVEIRSVGRHFEVIVEGDVGSLKVGPQGHLEEMKPSWLEYIINQQFIGFFWSALVFLWGMVWSIRRFIFSG